MVGVSDYAQHLLSDVVYVDLPEVGDTVTKGESLGTVESVKAAEDAYSPISGEVVEINSDLEDHPEWVNEDPYGKAWLIKVKPSDHGEMNDLMAAAAYEAYVTEEEERERTDCGLAIADCGFTRAGQSSLGNPSIGNPCPARRAYRNP